MSTTTNLSSLVINYLTQAQYDAAAQAGTLNENQIYLTPAVEFIETDPTVPSWAKQTNKPSYNFSEIGSTPTTLSGYGITNAYTKTEVDGLVSGVLHYKGTKTSSSALPSSGNTTGDVWHVTDTGAEYAWDGSTWQELGTAVDLSGYLLSSEISSWAKQSTKPSYALSELTGAADVQAIEGLTGTSGLLKKTAADTWTLDTSTYLTSYTETDPTVPSWAKASTKPTYTAAEVGALPDSTVIPSKTSELTNDSGFITSYTDEKLKTTAAANNTTYYPIIGNMTSTAETKYYSNKFTYEETSTTSKLSLGSIGTEGVVILYSSNENAGNFIRLKPVNLTNSRTITLPDKAGTIALTDDIPTVPTKVSDLTNDSGFISSYTETDPVFTASAAAGITATDISNWNAKVSDDKTWNNKSLLMISSLEAAAIYVPQFTSTSATSANVTKATSTPEDYAIAKYSYGAYLKSTTPSANDNSTKVATTAYVDAAIPKVYSSTNTGGYLTMATLPIYDGTVV